VGQDTISTDTLVVSQADTIVLSLTDSLLCGTSLDTMVVMNSPEETAGLDNASTICINDSIDLLQLLNQASSENGYWVELSSGNELMSPQLVVSDIPGSYDYYYIIENPIPCSNDTAMFTITVSDIDVDAGQDMSSSYCQEDMIILENLISGDPGGFFTDDSGLQIMNTAFVASELNAGNNIFNYIIDTGNCGSDTAELLLNVYEEIPETVVDNILCQDETILVNNTTYDINNASGSEILFSVDGCDSLVVIDLEFHIDAQSNITDLLCTGDSIIVEGEVYNESNSTGTVIIPGGSEFGCDSTVIIDLSFADFIDTLISYQLCEDQTVTIENVLFDINNPSNTITLENGASNGCDSIINVDLTFVSAFNEEIQSELCPGEEINVNGSIYDINNPVGSEILTASNGCDSIVDIMLSFYMQGEMNLTVDLCDDETIMVGNDVYGALNLDGVSIIENGDINGCDSIINVFINYSQSIELSNSETLCENDSIFIVDEWINLPGNYIDTLMAFNGCDSIINTEITLIICSVDFQSATVNETCAEQNDGSFEFEVLNTSQYPLDYSIVDEFSNTVSQGQILDANPLSVNDLAPGSYTIIISKDGQNLVTEMFEIIPAIPLVIDGEVSPVPCFNENGGSININISGGTGSYFTQWNGGENSETISNLAAGTYSVTVSDSEGCSVNENFEVSQPEEIQYELTSINSNCSTSSNGIITANNISGGTPQYTFSIDGNTFSPSNTFNNLEAASYTVFVSDQNGCSVSSQVLIQNEDALEILAPGNITLNQGDSVEVTIELNFTPQSIEWTPVTGLSCNNCSSPIIYPSSNTTYQITASDEFGCQVTTELFVAVVIPEPDIFIPNIFSPFNNDGSNREFAPLYDLNSDIQITSFRIFDRWGNMVFNESLNEKAWKGFINGEKAQQGVYMYAVEFKDGENEILKTGQVLLVW
ncbi:MAG: gliding motility-associated C-terminal domain-containing protein, partial [Bacteroidia bacterium]|nr:gliding motility-associated C-terminal domain-containing protein [Bacteroidia bacterium]